MKKVYLLLPVFVVQFAFAQDSQRYYSGTFLNEKKKPQSFLKIFNKNSGVYELTDEKGYAIIAAKEYDTLVWNNGKNIELVRGVYELKYILERSISRKNVENISSKDYESLLDKPKNDEFSIGNSYDSLRKNSDHHFSAVRKLKLKSDSLYKIKNQPRKYLVFNGSFSNSLDIKNRNRIPQTHSRYVQGRSENGLPVWKGPETGEMFSFGPDISTLGFNGESYQYDINGQLINLSEGISPANIYNNNIFKTTVGYSNQLNVNAIINNGGYEEDMRLSFSLGQRKDQMYFIDQFDITNSFKTKFTSKILNFNINAGFNFEENKATNTNRIGLFNRAYQNSLLTPVSFSNQQNAYLNNGLQRTYSLYADNPEFLFKQENKYNYYENIRQFNFDVSKNWDDFKLNISQAYDNQDITHRDIYKPSTNGFINGLYNRRNQKNEFYNSNISASYEFGDNDFKNKFGLNYILNNRKVNINHSLDRNYIYQRTSQDYIFNYNLDYDDYDDVEFGVNVGNSFYISNTSSENAYWLPKANGYFTFKNLFNKYGTKLQLFGAYTKLASEPEIAKSYSSYTTTQFSAQNFYQYFPLKEVDNFRNLSNVNIKEWKTGFKFILNGKIDFSAEYFNRQISDDIFPIFEGQNLVLKNLADHMYKGFEVNLNYDRIITNYNFSLGSKASFFKYRDVVDRVNSGYNNLKISGFSDIYKTLSEGKVLGAVVGSYYARNDEGKIIIDNNGYSVKASGMKIIADPTPDFVMKFSHNFTYKMFALDVNWEWKKGGQIWNGTQAVLDYYGRSQTSADERNIKKYVFEGVNYNGNTNQIPVDFYNPDQSVNDNRWTRYGFLGVAENYVEKSDYIRINDITLSAYFDVGKFRKALTVSFYVNNILLWQANSGVDSNQNFYDFDNSRGLDFFNLPSFKTYGCTVSFKF
ncbi:TonB-dependent receptor [Chryseobacterium terrae]|uniref:TonB-linked outer membrane protein, SusC/RagA family n=1 Tax=Chryseobacterium terrae TaxID=3163299 RepID=A0ABW8Y1V9_9FLAO